MNAEKQGSGGKFLKVDYVKENKISELKIVSEVTTVEFDSKTKGEDPVVKYQAEVTYDGIKDGDPNIWTLNHPSSNALIDTWGEDTEEWMNKAIPLVLAGEGDYLHFKVDELRID